MRDGHDFHLVFGRLAVHDRVGESPHQDPPGPLDERPSVRGLYDFLGFLADGTNEAKT